MPHTKNIEIAEITFRFKSNLNIHFDAAYQPYTQNHTLNDLVEIDCYAMGAYPPFDSSSKIFEASSHEKIFYQVFKCENGYGFMVYNPTNNELQQYAEYIPANNSWKIGSTPNQQNELEPLRYPMGPLLMMYSSLNFDAVLMHASCIDDSKSGRLFTGVSGAGKSTISRIWFDEGCKIINDDRIMIRNKENNFIAYNTPMQYIDSPRKVKLNSIYLISHGIKNSIQRIGGITACAKTMAFSLQNNYDPETINKRLLFFREMCDKTNVYELGFVPDGDVVEFVRMYD